MAASVSVAEDDAGLLRAWLDRRDESALAALFARHAAALRAIARRVLRDEAESEDVAQEVFISLAEHAGSIGGPVEPWLRQVAAHTAISHLRSRNRRRAREAQVASPSGAHPVPPPGEEGLNDLVAECVAALSPAERELVLRVFWGGEAQRDLARELRVSPVAVHKRLRASLTNLRRQLARRGVRVGAAALLLSLGQLCGREPSEMAAPLRGTGWGMGLWLAVGALALVGAVALMLAQSPAFPDLAGPATRAAAAATAAQAGSADSASAGRSDRVAARIPGAAASAWLRPAAAGWQMQALDGLEFWRGMASRRKEAPKVGIRRLRFGEDGLELQGGADPVLRVTVPAGEMFMLMVRLPAAYAAGSQIRLEYRRGTPAAPWREALFTQVRAVEWSDTALVMAGTSDVAAGLVPEPKRSVEASSAGRPIMHGWMLGEQEGPESFVGQRRWWEPELSLPAQAGRPPWWPLTMLGGVHELRRLQVRTLLPDEREELVRLVVAPAPGATSAWVEQ